jgi:hypothetical protein
MELRLGHQVFHPGDFVLWHDIAPDAAPLLGDRRAAEAAATGAALVCADPERALAAGVRADGVIVDAGTMPAADRVAAAVTAGHPVLVSLAGPPADPGLLAAAAVYAWLGVRVVRLDDSAATGPLRQVLDMVASIKGTRQPAVSRRALG